MWNVSWMIFFCIFTREKCMWIGSTMKWEVARQMTTKSPPVNFYEHQVIYSNGARNTTQWLNSLWLTKNRYINMARSESKISACPKYTRHTHSFAQDTLGLMIRQLSGLETYFVCSSESCTETVVKNNYQFHTQQLCCMFYVCQTVTCSGITVVSAVLPPEWHWNSR